MPFVLPPFKPPEALKHWLSSNHLKKSEFSKLDSGARANLDFCRITIEAIGVDMVFNEIRPSSVGYDSAGGQPQRWTLPKGLMSWCSGKAYPGPRHSSQKVHWPSAENSGGLRAEPPWLKTGKGTRLSRSCPASRETTHSSPAARVHWQSSQGFQLRRTRCAQRRLPLGRELSGPLSTPHGFPQEQVKLSARSQRRRLA